MTPWRPRAAPKPLGKNEFRRLSALAVADACPIATLPATQFATALTGFLDAHSLTTPDEDRPANQNWGNEHNRPPKRRIQVQVADGGISGC